MLVWTDDRSVRLGALPRPPSPGYGATSYCSIASDLFAEALAKKDASVIGDDGAVGVSFIGSRRSRRSRRFPLTSHEPFQRPSAR